MQIQRELLGDWFILGSQSGWQYSLTGVGRPPLSLAELGEIDPSTSLDWGGNYYGPPLLKDAAQQLHPVLPLFRSRNGIEPRRRYDLTTALAH